MYQTHWSHQSFIHLALRTLLVLLVSSSITHATKTAGTVVTFPHKNGETSDDQPILRIPRNSQSDPRVLAFESAYNSFIECILTEKSICDTCSKKMLTLQENYHSLSKITSSGSDQDSKIDKTILAITKSLFFNAVDLYQDTGNCRKCEDNDDYSRFQDVYWRLDVCLDTNHNNSCTLCLSNFTELNNIYTRLVTADSICIGINEEMEDMSDRWSILGCPLSPNYNSVAISLAFAFVMIIPLLYILARVWYQPPASVDSTHGCIAGVHEATEKSRLLQSQSLPCPMHR